MATAAAVERLMRRFQVRLDSDLSHLDSKHRDAVAQVRFWRRSFWVAASVCLLLGGWLLMALTFPYAGAVACAAALVVFNLYV